MSESTSSPATDAAPTAPGKPSASRRRGARQAAWPVAGLAAAAAEAVGDASGKPPAAEPVARLAQAAPSPIVVAKAAKVADKPAVAKKAAKAPARQAAVPVADRKAKAAKTVKVEKVEKAVKPARVDAKPVDVPAPKAKLVRDSFTMPRGDFDLIDLLKDRALGFRRPTKKSELLRAGLQVLAALTPAELQVALGRLTPLKTGRPKKNG